MLYKYFRNKLTNLYLQYIQIQNYIITRTHIIIYENEDINIFIIEDEFLFLMNFIYRLVQF